VHLAQRVLVQVVQVDQREIAEIVQADLADLVQVVQVAQAQEQADLVDLVQPEIVQADLADLVQVAQGLADLPALAQGHREQLARQVVVQVVVRIHQVVAAMQLALLVNPVADLQRVASQSVQSVKSTTT
jgi:hypothetical protein